MKILLLIICVIIIIIKRSESVKRSTGFEMWPDFSCQNPVKNNRTGWCHTAISVVKYPGMDTGDEIVVYTGYETTVECVSSRKWMGCYIQKKMADGRWEGPRQVCAYQRDCKPKVLRGRVFDYIKEGEYFDNLKDPKFFDYKSCRFTTEGSYAMAGTWRCQVFTYDRHEYDPECCRYGTAEFTIKVDQKPRGKFSSTLPEPSAQFCGKKMRDLNCIGMPGHIIIDSPELKSGENLYLYGGDKFTFKCKTNFKWGYCGLQKKEGGRYGDTRIETIIYMYCGWKNTNCGKMIDVEYVSDDYVMTPISKWDENECQFETTVAPNFEGEFRCLASPQSSQEIHYEKCCLQAISEFKVEIDQYERGTLEKRYNYKPPKIDFKSVQSILGDSLECGGPKYAARHPSCINENFGIVNGPGADQDKTVTVAVNYDLRIECKANAPWSICFISHGDQKLREIDCQKDDCDTDPDQIVAGVKYMKPSKACSLEKKSDYTDAGKDWTCTFFALNPYNTTHECCRKAVLTFEVNIRS